MSKNKEINIMPINNNGERHGYWERYNYNGNLMLKGLYNNGKLVGYSEWNSYDGKSCRKRYNL
jgi:antitoxin component YwqK of YwqJK toxin-antitoxin module